MNPYSFQSSLQLDSAKHRRRLDGLAVLAAVGAHYINGGDEHGMKLRPQADKFGTNNNLATSVHMRPNLSGSTAAKSDGVPAALHPQHELHHASWPQPGNLQRALSAEIKIRF